MATTTRQRRTAPTQGRLYTTTPFEVEGLPARYPLTIYLPPGYDSSTRTYPVAYLFDGQNLFGDEGSYSGGWHLHQVLDRRAATGQEVPIVIGMHHGGATRMQEFCPWALEDKPGLGDRYLDWVVGPLADWVKNEFRIRQGAGQTMIGGSSLGGLMSLYGFLRHRRTFGKVLAMSPSLWVQDGEMLRYAEGSLLPEIRRIYLDAGGREERTVTRCQAFVRHLESRGMVQGKDLNWRPAPKAEHSERAWRRRLPKAIDFLYNERY